MTIPGRELDRFLVEICSTWKNSLLTATATLFPFATPILLTLIIDRPILTSASFSVSSITTPSRKSDSPTKNEVNRWFGW